MAKSGHSAGFVGAWHNSVPRSSGKRECRSSTRSPRERGQIALIEWSGRQNSKYVWYDDEGCFLRSSRARGASKGTCSGQRCLPSVSTQLLTQLDASLHEGEMARP